MSARWIRWVAFSALATGIALFPFGCAQPPASQDATPAVTAEQDQAAPSLDKAREAAEIAVAIEKEPGRLTEILEAHGTTPEAFQELLYQIAQDPELTEAYEAARTGSSP
jgi:uncharacterized lipoprotein YajG